MRLDSRQAIRQLLDKTGYLVGQYAGEIVLDLPSLTTEENTRLSDRLNKLNNACGCTAGAITSIVAIILFIVLYKQNVIAQTGSAIWLSFTGFTWFFLSGLAGKLAALLLIKYRLRRLLTHLIANCDQ